MRLQPHRGKLVVFSSSVDPADRRHTSQYKRVARTGGISRVIRISVLFAVIAVRPRWRPLLAGTVLAVLGVVERQGAGGLMIIPGLLLLWHCLMIPGDTDADRERRSQLKRELAAYSTQAQRCDLIVTLDRYPDGITSEIRDILASEIQATQNSLPSGSCMTAK
jgi:hypothetical protein